MDRLDERMRYNSGSGGGQNGPVIGLFHLNYGTFDVISCNGWHQRLC